MISSVQNPTVKALSKLQQKKYRQKMNQMIVEGEHLVLEAKRYGRVLDTYTIDQAKYPEATLLSPHVMKKITDTKNPPQVIAVCEVPRTSLVTERVLILEQIQDPGNLGTLLRSALAFDFKTIILDQCVDHLNPKVLRSTQGAVFRLNMIEMSVETFIDKNPHTILATHVSQEKKLTKPISLPIALILGNEGQGVKKSTLDRADYWMHIPTKHVESLNVSVAGSILMHQWSENALNPLIKG